MTMRDLFIKGEDGFTTVGSAVAILLVCALLFMSVRAFQVQSRAGQVQYVADAAALSADNAVAVYVTTGQVVDAMLLSFSLLTLTTYAVSAVAAFIPGAQGVSAKLADAGSRLLGLRNDFAASAEKGLNAAQKALPAICAVRAASCVKANAQTSGLEYAGIAIPLPLEGKEVKLASGEELGNSVEAIAALEDEIAEKSEELQEAERQCEEAQLAGWQADCGPGGMSMRERAGHLAGLSGSDNPAYSSPETWDFSVGLERAKVYYRERYYQEDGAGYDGYPDEVAESIAREKFYGYAWDTVAEGFVTTSSTGKTVPHLEKLARNTDGIRETYLYTEQAYPVSVNDGELRLHAWEGCPGYQEGSAAGYGSCSDAESGWIALCPECEFSVRTLGRVPAASTSIDNGFEYYYRAFVEAGDAYEEAAEREEQLREELEKDREEIVGALKKGLESCSKRYDPQPPGRYGCVSVVIAGSESLQPLPFVQSQDSLPARVAISGATLAADPAGDQGNVITEIGQGFIPPESLGGGLSKTIIGGWGSALQAYANGVSDASDFFHTTLKAIPLVGNDLSEKASKSFEDAIKSTGLKPAKLQTYRPVLVNTSHILERDGSDAAKNLLKMKHLAQAESAAEVGDLKVMADELSLPSEVGDFLSGGELVVATIPLKQYGFGLEDVKVTIKLSPDLQKQLSEAVVQFTKLGG